ncbi:hypothetical protein RHMOL_Rhmol09G0086400 [Rhododendron molle]|uniref:Uncharacterized protein n=1 Tax=Rhododendron molle TaxID=49168 RepID=A0ACC0MCJ7_RHOML|nr:hypothetical protein RHMOL_Rhmol09G0086400 [Rhododendron molle]
MVVISQIKKFIGAYIGEAQLKSLQPGTTERARGERTARACSQQRSLLQFHTQARATLLVLPTKRSS